MKLKEILHMARNPQKKFSSPTITHELFEFKRGYLIYKNSISNVQIDENMQFV